MENEGKFCGAFREQVRALKESDNMSVVYYAAIALKAAAIARPGHTVLAEAVDPLLNKIEDPRKFGWNACIICRFVEALGYIGDERALPKLEWLGSEGRMLCEGNQQSLEAAVNSAIRGIRERNPLSRDGGATVEAQRLTMRPVPWIPNGKNGKGRKTVA